MFFYIFIIRETELMKSIKEKRGITLIALAVTIIVILILAGVTIDAVFSEKGIINKAKEAANSMNNAVANDQKELNDLLEELNEIMNLEWNDNIEIPEENTIPEPEPEPPKIEDATDIQDENIQVEDKYGNKVTIPKGFEVVEEEGTTVTEGIVIQDANGNQFVWIPVGRVYKDDTGTNYSDIQLGRYTFDKSNGTPTLIQAAYTETNPKNYEQIVTINSLYQECATRANPDGVLSVGLNGLSAIAKDLAGFVESVKKNSGYYLARYEASYGSGSSVADYKPLSKVSTTIRTNSAVALTTGMLWNNLTQLDAAKIGRNMYKNDSSVGVESDLINSYAWDTAIVFIQEMGNSNYANKEDRNGTLKNTGTTGDKVCNIYDMASNCSEWSTEYSIYISAGAYAVPCICRGGTYINSINSWYTAVRFLFNSTGGISNDNSFRVLIYIK